MQIKHITSFLEDIAPTQLQESYDNAGLIVGSPDKECTGVLISLDVTEEVIDEALSQGANLIISHHPIIFKGLKRLNGNGYVERTVIKALKNDIALYAIHTNLDNVQNGVNKKICDLLGLTQTQILSPQKSSLRKLITFVPHEHVEMVTQALFEAGAGHIGNYDGCSFRSTGTGTFRAQNGAQPFVGDIGKLHHEPETRVETVFPDFIELRVVSALLQTHPYEEVAYDIIPLSNAHGQVGAGMVGELSSPLSPDEFVAHVKNSFRIDTFKATAFVKNSIQKVAVCGGSGSFLLNTAKSQKADVYLSADFKYHEFFDADQKITIVDIGHYESERFTIDLLHDFLTEKFPTFALLKSQVNTNPVNYF